MTEAENVRKVFGTMLTLTKTYKQNVWSQKRLVLNTII